MIKRMAVIAAAAVLLSLSGCAETDTAEETVDYWEPIETPAESTDRQETPAPQEEQAGEVQPEGDAAVPEEAPEASSEEVSETVPAETEEVTVTEETAPSEEEAQAPEAEAGTAQETEASGQETPAETPAETSAEAPPHTGSGQVIVLDPGHTAIMTGLKEPIGPGASELKDADTMGTAGVASGLTEYELNLTVCQKLREELQARGYEVYMTREGHNLSISCVERAQVANSMKADVFLRVHADGSTDSSAQGALTICITPGNPYHPELYAESRRLSDVLLAEYCSVTGAKSRGVWETDSMTGNNWSEVPVTLIELGFMTNPEEDLRMATEEYQAKMVTGIANGIDRYLLGQ